MSRTLQIMIDSADALEEVAERVGSLLRLSMTPRSEDGTTWYEGANPSMGIRLDEHSLENDDDLNWEDYRYMLDIDPYNWRTDDDWRRWIDSHGRSAFETLERMHVPLMMVDNVERKVSEYVPGRHDAEHTTATPGSWQGVPGRGRNVHILIASRAGVAEIAAALNPLLGIHLEPWHRGPGLAYFYRDRSKAISLQSVSFPQDWSVNAAGYAYDLGLRPYGLDTRKQWNDWVEHDGREAFEKLKTLGCSLLLTDGKRRKVAEYHPSGKGPAGQEA